MEQRFVRRAINWAGDLTHETKDGSIDVLGAGVALKKSGAKFLSPKDQIEHMREHDPEKLKEAVKASGGQKQWAKKEAEDVARELGSDLTKGLTSTKAKDQLQKFGSNSLAEGKKSSFMEIWFAQMTDVMSVVILVAALVNLFAVGDIATGSAMGVFYAASTIFNAVGEYSNADGQAALNAMGAAHAVVVRDGEEMDVPSTDLVPGDVVHFKSGDTIPADMRVAIAIDLRCEESVLTGESSDVGKSNEPYNGDEPFPENMLYSSTSCVAGKGVGVVTETGMRTQVGLIAERLDAASAGLSPLQETMNRLGGSVGLMTVLITVAITALCFFTKFQDPNHLCKEDDRKCFFYAALAQGLILGMSAVPTTLPLMTTWMLTEARHEITERNALVRKTSSIETLGCTMCICSDKTGTLTEGKMTAVKAVVPRKKEGAHKFAFYPTKGANPAGAVFKDADLGDAQKKEIDAIIDKRGTEFPLRAYGASSKPVDVDDAQMRLLLTAVSLNSYATTLQQDINSGKWVTLGNLSEGALVVAAAKAGIGPAVEGLNLTDVHQIYPQDADCEVPFSSARKMACTVHPVGDGLFAGGFEAGKGISHVAVIKGAPDRLLPLVTCSLAGGSNGTLTFESGFDAPLKKDMMEANASFAADALRVLMVCVQTLTKAEVDTLRTLDGDERMDMVTKRMAIVGTFGILDPPKPTVRTSIARCKAAGIRVVMITGDQPATAGAIGASLNIVTDKKDARLCSDLHSNGELLSPEAIDELVLKTSVWARAQPSDKVAIVESLQRMGFTAAMTGDGVNDAPALKLADIGTAMGVTGTEVAKGAADLVLLDDDFTTIVEAVQEGRRTYANIQTYVGYYLAMSLPEIFTFATCVVAGVPMPLTPFQMLLMSGAAHLVSPMFLSLQPLPDDAMAVPPRRPDSKLLTRPALTWLIVPWIIIWWASWFTLNLACFYLHTGFLFTNSIAQHERSQHEVSAGAAASDIANEPLVAEGTIETMVVTPDGLRRSLRYGSAVARSTCFLAGAICENWLVLSFSSDQPFIFSLGRNPSLVFAILFCCAGVFFVVYLPLFYAPFAEFTGLVPVPARELGLVFLWIFVALSLLEVSKICYRYDISQLTSLRKFHALMASKGLLSVKATDEEVAAYRKQHPPDDLDLERN